MLKKTALFALPLLASVSVSAIEPSDKAIQLAQDTIITDGHIDVPYRLNDGWEDVTQATDGGDFDYPRAVQGGLNAPFMSIYIPARYEKQGGSVLLANKLIDSVEAIVGRAPGKFALATSPDEVEKAFAEGKIALPMGMENGTPIEGKIENLKHFYDRGVRYITLAHSESNHISDSSYDLRRQWDGLSDFGKELVVEMNRIGMMVDISHVSDDAFWQVMKISKAPAIASHSSLRKYTPGFERNMSDDMVKALAENGGVIMINFGSSFVSNSALKWNNQFKDKMAEKNLSWGDSGANKFAKMYRKDNPYPYASLKRVLDHIDHVVELVGIDHVGIGSDYDGVGDSLPENLKDVSSYPNLVQGLIDRGYSDADIKKILSENTLRVWREVEAVAKQMQQSS
ncbi:Membrane dipeptidase [Saliniradius amylolyticus]|uniref:Membrane dipeptidase n=1 Tax=Saliniradius amylolyticus TaxID=2183582 RepID=A0A2S2DZA2_9ALTE|nr:dipeptidase [Saliniradius amylolyticus]AWL10721.1 Membrane dipeptidase [Saliniradius amylolyticus]